MNEEEQYAEFWTKIKSFSLSEFIKKTIPTIQFEEEISSNGNKYLKTKDCMFLSSNSKLPYFYVDDKAHVYRCFDCGKLGGPLDFISDYLQLDNVSSFKLLCKEINSNVSNERTIEKIIKDLLEYGYIYGDIQFESAYLIDKSPMLDGTWEIYGK